MKDSKHSKNPSLNTNTHTHMHISVHTDEKQSKQKDGVSIVHNSIVD